MFVIKPGDDTVTKSMRMPKSLAQKMDGLAEEYNVSFTDLVLQCLEYALDNMQTGENMEKTASAK
ncbi:MAG: hypothetical protein IKU32_04050 [Clostridia bacterium]|nr:hypothetical protein [Clostridia bacterium]